MTAICVSTGSTPEPPAATFLTSNVADTQTPERPSAEPLEARSLLLASAAAGASAHPSVETAKIRANLRSTGRYLAQLERQTGLLGHRAAGNRSVDCRNIGEARPNSCRRAVRPHQEVA